MDGLGASSDWSGDSRRLSRLLDDDLSLLDLFLLSGLSLLLLELLRLLLLLSLDLLFLSDPDCLLLLSFLPLAGLLSESSESDLFLSLLCLLLDLWLAEDLDLAFLGSGLESDESLP